MTLATGSPARPWDDGVTWRSVLVTEATQSPFDLEMFKDQILRASADAFEDGAVRLYLEAAVRCCEQDTGRSVLPQTWQMLLSGFPASGRIKLPWPPLVDVTSLAYYDTANAAQELATSPAEFLTVASGRYARAEVLPLAGESFPSTYDRPDAVTITYTAGYSTPSEVPADLRVGIALLAGELYKQRTLSVHAVHNTAALLNVSRFWQKVR